MLQAGKLDRRITLRRAQIKTNDFGENVETWSDLATVWASRVEVSNRERFAAQQVGAELVARYRIRWSQRVATLSQRDRLVELADGQEHNITGVSLLGRRIGYEITAAFREGSLLVPPDEAAVGPPVLPVLPSYVLKTEDGNAVTTTSGRFVLVADVVVGEDGEIIVTTSGNVVTLGAS